jgi:hypothetical protein
VLHVSKGLGFPGGVAPGFDASHLAASQTRFSGIAMGGNFVDLLTGKPGVVAGGSFTAGIGGIIGPYSYSTTSALVSKFSGKPATVDTAVTFGAIAMFTSIAASPTYLFNSSDSSGSGVGLAISSAGVLSIGIAGIATIASAITLSPNISYFLAASANRNGAGAYDYAFVAQRLDNGQCFRTSGTSGAISAPVASTGAYDCGGRASTTAPNAQLSAMMYSTNFTPVAALQMWVDPWSFWYPDRD